MVIFLSAELVTEAQPKEKGATVTVDGLIIPRDDGGMYVQNSEEQLAQWKAFQAKQRAAREKKAKEKKAKEKK